MTKALRLHSPVRLRLLLRLVHHREQPVGHLLLYEAHGVPELGEDGVGAALGQVDAVAQQLDGRPPAKHLGEGEGQGEGEG